MTPGQRFGDLVIEARLGAGGMGVVYRARHEGTGAQYALKVLGPSADPEEVRRFVREGEALAAVDDHPHVVRVHAAGEVQGRRYLLMQLCTGGDLKARLRAGGLPFDEAARVVAEVARGVAHVHAKGIVHRDLKPENVLFDDDGRTRVTDFGLARVAGAESLTATGTFLGTPAYMAPEQADGGKVDARADVWSLGGLLTAALTGRPPYTGTTPINVLSRLLSEDPRWPSADRPDTPPALEAIVRRAMARALADRYPSAAALADDLERYLAGDQPGRRRGAGGPIAAALFVGLVLGAAAVWSSPQAPARVVMPAPAAIESRTADAETAEPLVERPALRTWEQAPGGAATCTVTTPGDPTHLLFLDSTRLLVAHDGGVTLVDASTGETLREWALAGVRSVARAGADVLLCQQLKGTSVAKVLALDPAGREPRDVLTFPSEHAASALACSADGRVVAVGDGGGRVEVLSPTEKQRRFELGRGARACVALAPGGDVLVCAVGMNVQLLRHEGDRGWVRKRETRLLGEVRSLLLVDADQVFVGTTSGVLARLGATWDEPLVHAAPGMALAHSFPIRDLATTSTGLLLSVASHSSVPSGELRAWTTTGEWVWQAVQDARLQAVAVSPDGRFLALAATVVAPSADQDGVGRVDVWEHPR